LHGLAGPPDVALGRLADLLRAFALDPAPVEEIDAALSHFASYGAQPGEVIVDLSLARGLRYYTGLVFEIYDDGPEGPLQLCGGGRYDDLVRALGGRVMVPACGFSVGLERARMALARRRKLPVPPSRVQVLVVPVTPDDQKAAAATAQRLRVCGCRVELDLRERGPRSALRLAAREAIAVAVLVGAEERASSTLKVRRLATHEETSVPSADLEAAVSAALADLPEGG
jgi:histidyl-tRNA synthetase